MWQSDATYCINYIYGTKIKSSPVEMTAWQNLWNSVVVQCHKNYNVSGWIIHFILLSRLKPWAMMVQREDLTWRNLLQSLYVKIEAGFFFTKFCENSGNKVENSYFKSDFLLLFKMRDWNNLMSVIIFHFKIPFSSCKKFHAKLSSKNINILAIILFDSLSY